MKFTWSNKNTSPIVAGGDSWHAPLNKPTSLSKVVAAIVVIILPFLGFFLGVQYAANYGGASVLQAFGGY